MVIALNLVGLHPTPPIARAEVTPASRQSIAREQRLSPLPGGLDRILLVNDNNPELITGDGILLSTFPGGPGLNQPLNGRFDLFSHHVYAGTPETVESTLWMAVLADVGATLLVTLNGMRLLRQK